MMVGSTMLRKLRGFGFLCLLNTIVQYLNIEELAYALILCYGSVVMNDFSLKTLKCVIKRNSQKWTQNKKNLMDYYLTYKLNSITDVLTGETKTLKQITDPDLNAISWRELTPRELLENYQTSVNLFTNPHSKADWKFDTFLVKPGIKAAYFNPKYPIALLHTENANSHRGPEADFVVIRLPGKIRNEKGQIMYKRTFIETSGGSRMISRFHWSPNGLYLSVFDHYDQGPSVFRFFRFYDKKSSMREIKNLTVLVNALALVYSNPWSDDCTAMINLSHDFESPRKSTITIKVIKFSSHHNTYETKLIHQDFSYEPCSFGGIWWERLFAPIQNGEHFLTVGKCERREHHHDIMVIKSFNKRNQDFFKKIFIPGIVFEFVSVPKEDLIVVMFGSSKHYQQSFVYWHPPLYIDAEPDDCPIIAIPTKKCKFAGRNSKLDYTNTNDNDSDSEIEIIDDEKEVNPYDCHLCYVSLYKQCDLFSSFQFMEINVKTWNFKILESQVLLPINSFNFFNCENLSSERLKYMSLNQLLSVSKNFITVKIPNTNRICHVNRKLNGFIISSKHDARIPACHISGYTSIGSARWFNDYLKFYLFDSASYQERKKLKRSLIPCYNSGVNYQPRNPKKRKHSSSSSSCTD